MKQLGNLAHVCAGRKKILFQVYEDGVAVFVGDGPDKELLTAKCADDESVSKIIHELNFGRFSNYGKKAS